MLKNYETQCDAAFAILFHILLIFEGLKLQ
jgi:hypothetical protein